MEQFTGHQPVLETVIHDFELVTGTCWMQIDPNKWKQDKRDFSKTMENELKLFQNMMSLMKFKLDEETRKIISYNLSLLLIQENGLLKMITAVFDLDETSQKVTTLDQRFMAVSNVVCFMPCTCVPFTAYMGLLAPQVHALFTNPTGKKKEQMLMNLRKIGTHIVNGMFARKKKESIKHLIHPVISGLQSNLDSSRLSLDDCIDIIYGLTISNFDMKYLIPSFSNLFYARCILEPSVSAKKNKIFMVLTEFMRRIEHSVYLLDDCLFNHLNGAQSFEFSTDDKDGSCNLFKKEASQDDGSETSIKMIDTITLVAINVVEASLPKESKVDLCILLLERLSLIHVMKPSQGLLLCSFLSTVQEKIQDLFVQYPTKFIRFVVSTLNRCVSKEKSLSEIDPNERSFSIGDEDYFTSLKNDSTSVAIEILKIIVSEKEKLDRDATIALKECVDALEKVIKVVNHGKVEVKEPLDVESLVKLKDGILNLDPENSCRTLAGDGDSLDEALKDLNDPSMPTRAHSLVTIKHLIMAKDKDTLENKDRILELLKASIADEESYIYLLAINTLATLAISETDQVLPVLTGLYLNEHRSIQERINVGEVILQLIKNMGDFGPQYSQMLLDCFYAGITHEDPTIRTSSISNLGQLCSILKYSLRPHINQIIVGVKCLIQTESDLHVKRAAVMLLHLLLNGLDADCVDVISDQLQEIYHLAKIVYSNSLDDVMQLHAQLALEQLDRIGRQLLCQGCNQQISTKKELIQVLD